MFVHLGRMINGGKRFPLSFLLPLLCISLAHIMNLRSIVAFRLKKEMILRVNQVASEFRKVSNKQMAETTKRTIRENVAVNAQLSKVSDKTVELITENDQLMGREKQHRKQIELLESNEKELSRKSHSSQKVSGFTVLHCLSARLHLVRL